MTDALAAVPGFTPEQSLALRTVARQTAEEMVSQLNSKPCGFDCQAMAEVRTTLYGAGNDDGLKTTVTKMQKDVESLVWWYRGLVVAVVSSWIAMLVSYLQ